MTAGGGEGGRGAFRMCLSGRGRESKRWSDGGGGC